MGNLKPIAQIYEHRRKSLNLSAVYAIKNLDNGKVYVGSAVNLKRRIGDHLRDLTKGEQGGEAEGHHSIKLQRAWNLHGGDRFTLIVLEEVEVPNLLHREQHWMDKLKCVKHGYNIYPTAGSALGVKHRPEVRQAMSRQRRGRKYSPESRKRMGKAQRERFAEAPMGEATKRRIGKAQRERFAEAPMSEAYKRRISAALKGRPVPSSTRNKLSRALKGRVITEEWRIKGVETQSALTKEEHHQACGMWHLEGYSLKEISDIFDVAQNTISRYVNGVTQKHWFEDWKASQGIEVTVKRWRRLSGEDVFSIFDMRHQDMYQIEIAKIISDRTGLKIGRTTIDNILNGRNYTKYAEEWLRQRN